MAATGRALTIYIRVVTALGSAVVVYSLVSLLRVPHLLEWSAFAVLSILTGSFFIRIATTEASISIADTFFISSALLFGPEAATVAIAADSCIFSWRKKHGWSRIVFNAVAPAVSLWSRRPCFLCARRCAAAR